MTFKIIKCHWQWLANMWIIVSINDDLSAKYSFQRKLSVFCNVMIFFSVNKNEHHISANSFTQFCNRKRQMNDNKIKKTRYFFLVLGDVLWKTLLAAIRFSMYWPRTWFSDFNLRFSSFTESTLWDRSEQN